MSVHIEIHQAGIGIIINFSGALTLSDFHEVQDVFLTSTEKLKHVKYVILDLTFVDSLNIPYGDVELLAERSKLIADSGPPGVLHAVAAPRDLGYGLARMWQVLSEHTGWEILVLRSRSEAEEWIRKRAREKFGLDI